MTMTTGYNLRRQQNTISMPMSYPKKDWWARALFEMRKLAGETQS